MPTSVEKARITKKRQMLAGLMIYRVRSGHVGRKAEAVLDAHGLMIADKVHGPLLHWTAKDLASFDLEIVNQCVVVVQYPGGAMGKSGKEHLLMKYRLQMGRKLAQTWFWVVHEADPVPDFVSEIAVAEYLDWERQSRRLNVP